MTARAYASIDDVLALMETQPQATKQPRIETLLTVSAEEINRAIRRDYFRHPVEGEETRYLAVPLVGDDQIHVHGGIVSLSGIEYSNDDGATWTGYESGVWTLTGASPYNFERIEGEPYFHIVLNATAFSSGFATVPWGYRALRATGVFGWDPVPSALVEANAERARQLLYGEGTYAGSVPGLQEYSPVEYAQPLVSVRYTHVYYNFVQAERQRFRFCRTGF